MGSTEVSTARTQPTSTKLTAAVTTRIVDNRTSSGRLLQILLCLVRRGRPSAPAVRRTTAAASVAFSLLLSLPLTGECPATACLHVV